MQQKKAEDLNIQFASAQLFPVHYFIYTVNYAWCTHPEALWLPSPILFQAEWGWFSERSNAP